MNNYKVTATRSDGTEVSDIFTEPTEGAARKSFKECYRHDVYTITSVELISEDAPATKQQERATLEAIRKMVAKLGPDSYIATAFEGCFEIAEQNIDNDFADSMAGRLELEREKTTHNAKIADEACKALLVEKDNMEALKDELETTREKLDTVRKNAETLNHWLTEQKEATTVEKQRADAAEETITQLKAKLYDMLTA